MRGPRARQRPHLPLQRGDVDVRGGEAGSAGLLDRGKLGGVSVGGGAGLGRARTICGVRSGVVLVEGHREAPGEVLLGEQGVEGRGGKALQGARGWLTTGEVVGATAGRLGVRGRPRAGGGQRAGEDPRT